MAFTWENLELGRGGHSVVDLLLPGQWPSGPAGEGRSLCDRGEPPEQHRRAGHVPAVGQAGQGDVTCQAVSPLHRHLWWVALSWTISTILGPHHLSLIQSTILRHHRLSFILHHPQASPPIFGTIHHPRASPPIFDTIHHPQASQPVFDTIHLPQASPPIFDTI